MNDPGGTLHPQVRRLLDLRARWPDLTVLTPARARANDLELARRFGGEPPPVAAVEDVEIPISGGSIPARVYRHEGDGAPAGLLVWLHGGGWVLGSVETSDVQARALARASRCVVLSVGYRLAPEHRFPVPLEDAAAAVAWAHAYATDLGADPARLAVGGESAGGNLAAAVCLRARDRGGPPIAFQLLVYPVTCRDLDVASRTAYAEGHGLTAAGMAWFWERYLSAPEAAADPYASPLLAPALDGLPPAYVAVAELDLLRDEALRYAERLRDAGVPTAVRVHRGMVHGFLGAAGLVDEARIAVAEAGAAVRRVLSAATSRVAEAAKPRGGYP